MLGEGIEGGMEVGSTGKVDWSQELKTKASGSGCYGLQETQDKRMQDFHFFFKYQ